MSDIKPRLPNRHCAPQLTSRTLRDVNGCEPHSYRHVVGPMELTAYKVGLWQTQIS